MLPTHAYIGTVQSRHIFINNVEAQQSCQTHPTPNTRRHQPPPILKFSTPVYALPFTSTLYSRLLSHSDTWRSLWEARRGVTLQDLLVKASSVDDLAQVCFVIHRPPGGSHWTRGAINSLATLHITCALNGAWHLCTAKLKTQDVDVWRFAPSYSGLPACGGQ